MAERPMVALPARFAASTSALRHEAEVAARRLVRALYAAGAEPWVMHPHAPDGTIDEAEVGERLLRADAVLLPGGGDVAGHWAGQPEHPTLYDVSDEQDAFDLAVARVALERGTPLLSVCRGTQIVNVALGGTLVQDMDEVGGPVGHHRHRVHQVRCEQGSQTADLLGEELEVSCYHHQCLDTLGTGLVVVARAEEGVPEAVELRDSAGWYLGVQWHPEDSSDRDPLQQRLFEGLVEATRGVRA